jgi:hypothetical protein
LALAGIGTVEAANRFIRKTYVPAHNARFMMEAEQEASAPVAIPGVDPHEVLCIQEERQGEAPAVAAPLSRPVSRAGNTTVARIRFSMVPAVWPVTIALVN